MARLTASSADPEAPCAGGDSLPLFSGVVPETASASHRPTVGAGAELNGVDADCSSASGEAGPSGGHGEARIEAPEGLSSSSPSGEASAVSDDVPGNRKDPDAAEVVSAPAPTAHHPHGMSRWPAVLACPCFLGKEGGADAALGTKVHAFLAWVLTELKERGRLPEVDAASLSFQEGGALKAARWVADTLREEMVSPRALRIEERVTFFSEVTHEHIFGTADCLWQVGSTITVLDFKTFWNPGRDYTAQLAGYGYAAACASKEEVTHLRLVVAYGDHDPVDERVITKEEAGVLCAQACRAFESGRDAPRQCAWCELCERMPACEACLGVAAQVADVEAPAKVAADWGSLTPTRKAQLLVVAEFASKWADAVRAHAKEDLLAGVELVDPENGIAYGLRSSRGRLSLDVDALWAEVKRLGISSSDFRACLKADATSAKSLLRKSGLTAKAAEDLLETCGRRGAGSQVLARM